MNLKEKLDAYNKKIKDLDELTKSIAVHENEFDSYLVENTLEINQLESSLWNLMRQKEIHYIFDILKDTKVTQVQTVEEYDSDDQGGTLRYISFRIDEKFFHEDEEGLSYYYEGQLNSRISNEYFSTEIIDLTAIKSLYENKKILSELSLNQNKKTKISKV